MKRPKAGAEKSPRKPYTPPKLTVYGAVSQLTTRRGHGGGDGTPNKSS
jgi:hypothetical protein